MVLDCRQPVPEGAGSQRRVGGGEQSLETGAGRPSRAAFATNINDMDTETGQQLEAVIRCRVCFRLSTSTGESRQSARTGNSGFSG